MSHLGPNPAHAWDGLPRAPWHPGVEGMQAPQAPAGLCRLLARAGGVLQNPGGQLGQELLETGRAGAAALGGGAWAALGSSLGATPGPPG